MYLRLKQQTLLFAQIKIKSQVNHTLEVTLGALLIANLGAGPAIEIIILKNSELRTVGVHSEGGYSVSPDAVNGFFERRSNVHQAGIVGENPLGLLE